MKYGNIIICAVWALFLQSAPIHQTQKKSAATPQRITHRTKIDTISNDLNYCNVYLYAKKQGIKFAEVYIRQCIMESGHFTSEVCTQRNNIHGMHHPTVRKTTSIAKRGEKYAKYKSWKECVKDYKLWQDMHKQTISDIDSIECYIVFLRRSGYIAGSASYYEKELMKIDIPDCGK